MVRKIIALLLVFAFFTVSNSILHAQGIKTHLTERNGARAIGMGHAFTGVAEGLTTILWNPAGLVSVNGIIDIQHAVYNGFSFYTYDPITGEDIEQQTTFFFYNFGIPIDNIGTVAFSMNLWDLGSSAIIGPRQDIMGIDYQNLLILYGSFARRIIKEIDFGITVKYIRERLSSSYGGIGTSVAVDIGMLCRPIEDVPLQVGLAVLDIGTDMKFKYKYQSDRLPRRFRIGISYDIIKHLLDHDRFKLLLAMDYERFLVGSPKNEGFFTGAEFSITALKELRLSLRSGYQDEGGGLNGTLIGCGINWKIISFDWARELGVSSLVDRNFYSLAVNL